MSCLSQLEMSMSRVRDVIIDTLDTNEWQFAMQKWNFLHKMVQSYIQTIAITQPK